MQSESIIKEHTQKSKPKETIQHEEINKVYINYETVRSVLKIYTSL